MNSRSMEHLLTTLWPIIRWPLLALGYLAIIAAGKWVGFVFLCCVIGLAVYLLQLDKERETKGEDHVWGEGLFYRYGNLIEDISIPIPVKPDWNREQTEQFAADLRQRLAARLLVKVPEDRAQVLAPLSIVEQKTQQVREFLRILIRSAYGSRLTLFVHFTPFGGTVAAYYVGYVRGRFSEWDEIKFGMFSPFTIWGWIIPWAFNRYSLCASISHYADNDFDAIEMQGIYSATRNLVLVELEKLLEEDGLLSQTLQQIFNFCITNNNNSQNIDIKGSRLRIGPIGQTAVATGAGRP
jgi:hypothetical protein